MHAQIIGRQHHGGTRPRCGSRRGILTGIAGFENDDADKDGSVSRSEFSGPEDLFQQLDKDGDGYITREEARLGHPGPCPGGTPDFKLRQQ